MSYRIIAVVCYSLLSLSLGAQEINWQVFGYIHGENAEALPGARVIFDDSISINASNGGFFQADLKRQPTQLTVRCVGYFPRRIEIKKADFKRQKAVFDIALLPQNTELQEISIAAKKVETIVEENFQTDILDFDFAGENLLLLVKNKKKYALQLMSDKGKVLHSVTWPVIPSHIHRSCFGDLIVVSETQVNEVTLSASGVIDTFPALDLRYFKRYIEPCVQESQNYLYYRQEGTMNQALTYWYITPEGDRKVLAKVLNERGLKDAIEAYFGLVQGMPFTSRGPTATTPAVNSTKYGMDLGDASQWADFSINMEQLFRAADVGSVGWISLLQRIYADSVYAPLLKIGETLVLFDHVNGRIWQFDPRFDVDVIREIDYHKEAGWLKALLQDFDIPRIIYAHFAPKGFHKLKKINLSSGQAEKDYPLAEVDYLSGNFKVRSGFLYYLGQPDVNTPNHRLYKVNIAQKSN